MINTNAYVICLKKHNEKRCNVHYPYIQKLFKTSKRIDAVNGYNIDVENDSRISLYAKYHIQHYLKTDSSQIESKGAIGCALSHIKIWKQIVEDNKPSFIIEDDVDIHGYENKIIQTFENMPTDKSLHLMSFIYINSGFVTQKWKHISYNSDWYSISNRNFGGTQMYYLTPEGAQILLNHVFPINVHIDAYIAYLASVPSFKFNAIFLKKNILPISNELFSSLDNTINHTFTIKQLLPEENIYYYLFILALIMIFIFQYLRCRKSKSSKQ